jgi:cation:H+ antiporter
MLIAHIAVMAAASVVMGKTARIISTAIRAIAKHWGVSHFLASFFLLGFATSLPEISVAVFSAMQKTPELSLGNLLGANIVALSLLAGIAAIIAKWVRPNELYRNRVLALFLIDAILPVYAIADGRLTRVDGIFLTVAHIVFAGHLYRSHAASIPEQPEPKIPRHIRLIGRPILSALFAATMLLGASYFLVNSALFVAASLGTPPVIIGLLLFSLGTNLPELTFILTQAKGRNKDIVLGDLFGSVMLNTPTLGLLGIIHPFSIEQHGAALVSGGFLVVLTIIFGAFMWSKRELVRREGYWLIAFYIAYLLYYVRYL